jgi:hypothetical protein
LGNKIGVNVTIPAPVSTSHGVGLTGGRGVYGIETPPLKVENVSLMKLVGVMGLWIDVNPNDLESCSGITCGCASSTTK